MSGAFFVKCMEFPHITLQLAQNPVRFQESLKFYKVNLISGDLRSIW